MVLSDEDDVLECPILFGGRNGLKGQHANIWIFAKSPLV
jgi:hypothetical protein